MTETIDDLLERDIDDLVSIAAALRPDARNVLLASAAEALTQPALRSRLKLLSFVQALAAAPAPTLSPSAVEAGAIALITAAYADDPTERITALRALSVLASQAQKLNLALTYAMIATFEIARIDQSAEIRDFVNEILSDDNPVFRRLISMENATAETGELGSHLETMLRSQTR